MTATSTPSTFVTIPGDRHSEVARTLAEPVPQALSMLGFFYPWLVKSEVLHYGYALVMLAGLWIFRPGFTGVTDRRSTR